MGRLISLFHFSFLKTISQSSWTKKQIWQRKRRICKSNPRASILLLENTAKNWFCIGEVVFCAASNVGGGNLLANGYLREIANGSDSELEKTVSRYFTTSVTCLLNEQGKHGSHFAGAKERVL